MRRSSLAGFTLIEMVISIVVLGIVAVTIGAFLLPAITSHQDVQRRAALVDATESALRRMSRDIRISLPNSLRLTPLAGGFAMETIPTVDGARYCTTGTADCSVGAGDVLTVGGPADAIFDVLGCFRNAAFVSASGGSLYRLVIGSTGGGVYTATGANAVITPVLTITLGLHPNTGTATCGLASATANSFNRHRVTLGAAHTFPTASPRQRVFVVLDAAAPVTYICDSTAQTLTRYAGYRNGLAYSTATQPTNPLAAPLSAAPSIGRVAGNVTGCLVSSSDATVQGTSIVTLSLTLSNAGESVTLMSQVQFDNSQ